MTTAIVLDTETTGLDPAVDRLVEIAAIDVFSEKWHQALCNPGKPIPPETSAIHHIIDADVTDSPSPEFALAACLEHFNYPEYLIAHNAKFDREMIAAILPSGYSPRWICTYKNAMVAWPHAPNHKNQTLRYWRGHKPRVPEGLAPHRALYDVIVTREIFIDLISCAGTPRGFKEGEDIFAQMVSITANPILLKKISFGKHAGKPFSEIDNGYLRWILQQDDMNEDVRWSAEHELRKRRGGPF